MALQPLDHCQQVHDQDQPSLVYWNSNFDGTNTRGEGTLNWKGTTTLCGRGGAGGIACSGGTTGDPGFSNNPNRGAGCKRDMGQRGNRGGFVWYGRAIRASLCIHLSCSSAGNSRGEGGTSHAGVCTWAMATQACALNCFEVSDFLSRAVASSVCTVWACSV